MPIVVHTLLQRLLWAGLSNQGCWVSLIRIAGNILWEATQRCTEWAYDALRKQGLNKTDLYFLSADSGVDLDNNGFLDDVAGDATAANLQYGIETWAAGASDALVYLTGHGGMDGAAIPSLF